MFLASQTLIRDILAENTMPAIKLMFFHVHFYLENYDNATEVR